MEFHFPVKKFFCKATAILAIAFFISSGIAIPASFASVNELVLNETQRPAAMLTLAQANAQAAVMQNTLPSGAAVQNASPLSLPDTNPPASLEATPPVSVIINGDFSQKTSGNSLPDGWSPFWTTAESVPGYLSTYDGRSGVMNMSLTRNGRGMKQTYSTPLELDGFSLFDITFKIVSATLTGDGWYGIEAPVVLRANVLRANGSTYQATRYFNYTNDADSAGNANFVLVPQNQWVTRSFTAQELGLVAGDKVTEVDVYSGGWAREAYVDSVGLYSNAIPTVNISLTGVEAELLLGTDMTVTAVPDHPVDAYRWFLDGALIPDATTSAVTAGRSLTAGAHTLTVETTLGGVVASQAAQFQVIDLTQLTQLDIADQYAPATTAHFARDIFDTYVHGAWDPHTGTTRIEYYPMENTTYGYGDSLQISRSYDAWAPPADLSGYTHEDRALVEFDLSRWYGLGLDPDRIARVELLATVSGTGEVFQGYDFSINAMTALEDGLFSSAQGDFNVGTTSLQTVHALQLNSTPQDLQFNITGLLRNDLESGAAWSGIVFKSEAANLPVMQLANLRLKVYYDTNPPAVPPAQPVVTSNVPVATDQTAITLSGTKEAGSSIWINNVQAVASSGETTWTATVSLPTEGNNPVSITARNSEGLASEALTLTVVRDTVVPTGSININAGATYATSPIVTLNLSGADTGSGVSAMSFSADGTNWTASEAYTTSKSFTLSAGDGTRIVYVKYYDKAGNASVAYSKSIVLDTTPPTGTININSGAASTPSKTVTLNLSGTDSGSGVSTMSFSTDNAAWTTAEAYAVSKTFTLPSGNSSKTVFVKFFDAAGNVSAIYSKSIVLEEIQQPMPDTENLYSGRYYFGQMQNGVSVSQTSPGIYTYHKISSNSWVGGFVNPVFDGSAYDYVTLEARSLVAGSNSFIFEVKNYASYILRKTVSLQGTGWHTVQFAFPKGAAAVNFIAFSNPTNDFAVRALVFSDTPVFSGTTSIIQTSPPVSNALNYQLAYTLNGVSFQEAILLKEGNNTVTRTWVNASGTKVTRVFSVLMDTVKPTGSININSSALSTASKTVMLNLSGTDSSSGISMMSFSTDNTNWTAPAAYASTTKFTLPSGDGAKKVYVRYYDKAGNVSAVYADSIVLDTTPPQGTVKVNGGVKYISKNAVTLDLSAADAGSGLSKMSFSTNGKTWTTAEAYSAEKAWTFSAGDGQKTVYVKFRDKAGNWSSPSMAQALLDTKPPTGSIAINNKAASTQSSRVTLSLTGFDAGSGLDQMRFSKDGGWTWTAWEAFGATKSFLLSARTGKRQVLCQLRDKAHLTSTVFSDSIIVK